MKRIFVFALILIFAACGTKKALGEKPLYEVLTSQSNGGGRIRFNEILTEEREIKMLQNDDNIRKEITSEDLTNSNFIIINLGEKDTNDYFVNIKGVEETPDKIIITVDDTTPKTARKGEKDVYFYPYAIVKINSKKPIEIR